ncbi:MAG: hypothetical protein A2096_08435 [Spirochaetes bacterium GWF1_41_5]|nr:MAG: hypothetical protein A2096_08435 [Spirochaetes bacterium GWF1_41_5]
MDIKIKTITIVLIFINNQRLFSQNQLEKVQIKRTAGFTEKEIVEKTFSLAHSYFNLYQNQKTYICYSTTKFYTSAEDVKQGLVRGKPMPYGYGSGIEDTALHTGHILIAMLDAYKRRPDLFLETNIRNIYNALKIIYQSSPIPGLVPRGPHPDDLTACYVDSSLDQHTTFLYAMSAYANSSLASAEDKRFIQKSLDEIGKRLESYNWSIRYPDGIKQCHVGHSWLPFEADKASLLLASVYAIYKGTEKQYWLDLFEKLGNENNNTRWELCKIGKHIQVSSHPIYANQRNVRLNVFFHFLPDGEKKKIISDLLAYNAEIQIARSFPNEFILKFMNDDNLTLLKQAARWNGDILPDSETAWKKFTPELLDDIKISATAALAHVRFPLGGYHMVLCSENKALIDKHINSIWEMLNKVDLSKISAGETHYLFTVVAMHLYAYIFKN